MRSQEFCSIEELAAADLSRAALFSLPRFESRVLTKLGLDPRSAVSRCAEIAEDTDLLIALGGGTLIDTAKLWRFENRPELRLVAVPSLWGSGAEASRVVALNRAGRKHIVVDDRLIPEVRVIWPELIAELPRWRALAACGDAWSHGLEGFLSPLAEDALRAEIGVQLAQMIGLPLDRDACWFEPSARVSNAQGRASVGLIHGIAHTLEGPLQELDGTPGFGHARLCALFLKPVIAFNRAASPKFDELLSAHGCDPRRVLEILDELFDLESFETVLPYLEEHWRTVLRDPCTRTNSALVRPAQLSFFTERRFL